MAGAALVSLAAPAWAEHGFPESVKFSQQIQEDPDQTLVKEDVADFELAIDRTGTLGTKRGQHFGRWFRYVPAAGDPAPGYDNGTEERIFKAVTGPIVKVGWEQVWSLPEKTAFTYRLNKGGKDSWLSVRMDGPQAQVRYELIEVGDSAAALVLKAPAKTPEKFTDADPIPYLPLFPGSTLKQGGHASDPLDVTPPGSGDADQQLVGSAVSNRNYQGPTTLSGLQFVRDGRQALLKAGWKVLFPATDKGAEEASTIIAHFTGNGRDVWARLAYENGANLWYSVADVGGEDWAATLEKDCRLPLYGVFFDFDKATLKPESDPVLSKVAALLKARPGLTVEIQGHTDNKGAEDYNLKLSDARAASVKAWLGKNGIAAGRLASKGYGKSQPVADNATAEGRAKNRRVELVKSGCKK